MTLDYPKHKNILLQILKDIFSDTSLSDQKKWAAIMNLIGLDETVTRENMVAACAKFGIIQGQPVSVGLQYEGKGGVRIAQDRTMMGGGHGCLAHHASQGERVTSDHPCGMWRGTVVKKKKELFG